MASFNHVVLMGNLVRDVETRAVGSTEVAKFTVAVNEKYKTKAGELKESVAYVDAEVWGGAAGVASQYLSKGSPVHIAGKLAQDNWEDKDGNKRSKLYVKVGIGGLTLIGGKRDGGGGQQSAPSDYSGAPGVPDEEVPF